MPLVLGATPCRPILQRGQRDEWSGTFKSPIDISHPQSNSSHIQAPWLQYFTINPILQMPKQRFQQAKLFAQGHCTSDWGLRGIMWKKRGLGRICPRPPLPPHLPQYVSQPGGSGSMLPISNLTRKPGEMEVRPSAATLWASHLLTGEPTPGKVCRPSALQPGKIPG